jgi:glucosylceramidase
VRGCAGGAVCRDLPFPEENGWWQVGEAYGVGVVQYMQNWAVGFTDWNLLLDEKGGPSHDRRFGCNAPIMQCPATNTSCGPNGFAYQAPFFFMAHFSKYFVPGSTVIGAMAYAGEHCPAEHGHFYYAPGAEGAEGSGLGVVGAITPNGTTVLVVLNTGNASVTYTLKDSRMGQAVMSIAQHSIQTVLYNTA